MNCKTQNSTTITKKQKSWIPTKETEKYINRTLLNLKSIFKGGREMGWVPRGARTSIAWPDDNRQRRIRFISSTHLRFWWIFVVWWIFFKLFSVIKFGWFEIDYHFIWYFDRYFLKIYFYNIHINFLVISNIY